MKTKQKHSFWKGLLIYICVMLALICVGFFLFWNFMSAFEASQTDGVVNQYLKHEKIYFISSFLGCFNTKFVCK